MALTATQLRALLKANLHNDSTYSDPDDLNTFLTLGQERIVKDCPQLLGRKYSTITTTTSTREFALATDVYQVYAVWNQTDGFKLTFVPQQDFIETVERLPTIGSGPATEYTILGWVAADSVMKLVLNLTPSAAGTLKYWYWWMPAAISGSSTPALSSLGWSELLLNAASMIALGRNDPDASSFFEKKYDKLMEAARAWHPAAPDYAPALDPIERAPFGQTLRLPPSYPSRY